MKVRPSVKKICDKCKIVRRRGVLRIICDEPAPQAAARLRASDMARIAGVDLPRRKAIAFALPYIYGIGPSTAKRLCKTPTSPSRRRSTSSPKPT